MSFFEIFAVVSIILLGAAVVALISNQRAGGKNPKFLGMRSVERGILNFCLGVAFALINIVATYYAAKLSTPGEAWHALLTSAASIADPVENICFGIATHAVVIDTLAWRRVTYGELLTGQPESWRPEGFKVVDDKARPAALAGYVGTLLVCILAFIVG